MSHLSKEYAQPATATSGIAGYSIDGAGRKRKTMTLRDLLLLRRPFVLKGALLSRLEKGDLEGHPFRGNQWTSGEGGGAAQKTVDTGIKLSSVKDRAWSGSEIATKTSMSKLETGELGERILTQYLQDQGKADARPLNAKTSNFPVDLIQNHGVIEVKTGLVSNGKSAQQWRATIGQPGKQESAWLKKASPEAKAKWNERKAAEIIARKEAAVKQISKEVGRAVKGETMAVIINPDKKTADIFKFDGFHSRIGWKSPEAQRGYIGTVKYGKR
jgi:hypothetical protein